MRDTDSAIFVCPLFKGIEQGRIEAVLREIDACEMRFPRGTVIELDGTRTIAAVLEGLVQIVQDDYWGNRSIIHMLHPGKTMGESFTTFPGQKLNQKAVAQTDCVLLAFSKDRLLGGSFAEQKLLLENLLDIYSIHQRIFLQKFQILSRRKTRDRLITFLSMMALDKGSNVFTVPFTRQEMADYLCVERSAMCSELSALQKMGILRFEGRRFELIQMAELAEEQRE